MRRTCGGLNNIVAWISAAWFALTFAAADVRASDATHALNAKPVPLAENLSVGEHIGKVRFLGMLAIPSISINGVRLSQLSDLAWDENSATLYAIGDKGVLFHLHPVLRDGTLIDVKLSRAVVLRETKTHQPLRHKRGDAEGLTLARTGSNGIELIVSFERFPRIVRYRPDGYAIAEQPLPKPLGDPNVYAQENRMLESVCNEPRYGLLTMPERPMKNEAPGFSRLYSVEGKSWRYPVSDDSRVVSLSCPGNGEVLILETTFGLHFWRSQTRLKRVRLTESTDTPLRAETLFAFDAGDGYQIDNFEGIAHHRGRRFFLVSDDNEFFLQRTLLLYIELLDN